MGFKTVEEFTKESFDFLIVGGGSAGLAVAARLSDNGGIRVGVVEAGSSKLDDPLVNHPAGMWQMICKPEYEYNDLTVPQKAANGRRFHIPRGKMIGGSSALNFMAYGRPWAREIDSWSEHLGIKGWSFDDLLPWFKRTEKLEVDQPNIQNRNHEHCQLDENFHGLDGPIHTSIGPWQSPIEKDLLPELNKHTGLSTPAEPYNGSPRLGFYRSLFNVDRTNTPKRSYAGNGYLTPILDRENLSILTDAAVSKIILEERKNEDPVAVGVEFTHKDKIYKVRPSKDVILSAGSFKTPQLLELSGVGDPAILKEHGIRCIVRNDGVGKNLQDHTMTPVVYELSPDGISVDSIMKDPEVAKEQQRLFVEEGSGVTSGAISLTGYVSYRSQVSASEFDKTLESIKSNEYFGDLTNGSRLVNGTTKPGLNLSFQAKQAQAISSWMSGPDSPDIQLLGVPASFDVANGHSDCSKLMTGGPPGYNAGYSLVASAMHPLSRGSVHISSANPHDPPLIDTGYLSHPADVDIIAAGVALADQVLRSSALSSRVGRRVDPPPEIDLSDREAARAAVRERIVTYHHPLGTCAMGSVVDEAFHVNGVQHLRIVDASVIPMQVGVAIMATVYAVAEKAAHRVKQDYSIG